MIITRYRCVALSCSDQIYFKMYYSVEHLHTTLMEKYNWAQNVHWSIVPLRGDGTNTNSQWAHHITNTAVEQLRTSWIYSITHELHQQRADTPKNLQRSASQMPSSGPLATLRSMRVRGDMDSVGDWLLHTNQHRTLQPFCGTFPTVFHWFVQPQPRLNQPLTEVFTTAFNVNIMGLKHVGPTALTSLRGRI